MRIESLRVISYRSWKVDEVSGPVARERLRRLELFAELRAAGCDEALCLRTICWSRATCHRWRRRYREGGVRALESRSRRPKHMRRRCWTRDDEARVLALRDKQPLWGKRKIGAALRRDAAGFALSDSGVGRILGRAMKRGRIRPATQVAGRAKPKRPRAFGGHAAKWQYGMRADQPGSLVQMDHMSVSFPGTTIKSFTAVCPATGHLVARAYSRAYQQHCCQHRPHGGKKQNFQTPMAYYQSLAEAA